MAGSSGSLNRINAMQCDMKVYGSITVSEARGLNVVFTDYSAGGTDINSAIGVNIGANAAANVGSSAKYGLNIGAQSGATYNYAIRTRAGRVLLGDTVDSSSPTTGGLTISGGVGIAKKLFVGDDLSAAGGIINCLSYDTSAATEGVFKFDGSATITYGDETVRFDVTTADAISGTSDSPRGRLTNYTTDGNAAHYSIRKAAGNEGSPSAPAIFGSLGFYDWEGYDNSTFNVWARIQVALANNPTGSGHADSFMRFYVDNGTTLKQVVTFGGALATLDTDTTVVHTGDVLATVETTTASGTPSAGISLVNPTYNCQIQVAYGLIGAGLEFYTGGSTRMAWMRTDGMFFLDGTAGTPGIGFLVDQNSGLYRIGADNIGWTLAGALVGDWSTAGLNLASSKVLKVNGTQVVAARVVNGDVGNTPNTGDSDTDDMIQALADIITTHGLGAAA